MYVYVISKDGQPLMPTARFGKVRRLLNSKKAKVVKRCPFTIRLLYEPETRIVQETIYKAQAKYPSYLKKYFRKEKTLWSDGYFAGSIGEVSEETIR